MGILLAFAPFVAFALVDRLVGPTEGLVAGALAAAVLVLRDRFGPRGQVKLLEAGTLLLFGGLALYAVLGGPAWSVIGVRLCVDAGLLAIVLATIAIGRPFTLQYARDQVAPEFWDQPEFIRVNTVISAAWALAFAVMVLAELALLTLAGAAAGHRHRRHRPRPGRRHQVHRLVSGPCQGGGAARRRRLDTAGKTSGCEVKPEQYFNSAKHSARMTGSLASRCCGPWPAWTSSSGSAPDNS
ncbi:hypothetical protein [Dankookia sp. P2]|uniref:hypothetical protein n=1 Tax=Dankookia sp. P2 TaxID=3423955 RepID=UPI003D66FD69